MGHLGPLVRHEHVLLQESILPCSAVSVTDAYDAEERAAAGSFASSCGGGGGRPRSGLWLRLLGACAVLGAAAAALAAARGPARRGEELRSAFHTSEQSLIRMEELNPALRPSESIFQPTGPQVHWAGTLELQKVERALVRMEMERRRSFTIVAVFSQELLEMTNNWLCSLANGGPDLSRTSILVLAMDGNCGGLHIGVVAAQTSALCVPVNLAPPGPQEGAEPNGVRYHSDRYLFFCGAKLALFGAVMDAAIAQGMQDYKWLLFSDIDVAFKGDALGYFDSALERSRSSPASAGFKRVPGRGNSSDHIDGGEPVGVFQQNSIQDPDLNTGFYFLRAGPLGSWLLGGALRLLALGQSHDGADQGAVQLLLQNCTEERRSHFYMLPPDLFPTGRDYYRHLHRAPDALALHANWIVHQGDKVRCMKVSGDWLLTSEGQCSKPVNRWPWHSERAPGCGLVCRPGPGRGGEGGPGQRAEGTAATTTSANAGGATDGEAPA